jgi:hypothetical protein
MFFFLFTGTMPINNKLYIFWSFPYGNLWAIYESLSWTKAYILPLHVKKQYIQYILAEHKKRKEIDCKI